MTQLFLYPRECTHTPLSELTKKPVFLSSRGFNETKFRKLEAKFTMIVIKIYLFIITLIIEILRLYGDLLSITIHFHSYSILRLWDGLLFNEEGNY